MKKKLIDLTIEELEKICDTHKCSECPCCVHGDFEETCWKDLVENGIKSKEVEIMNTLEKDG